MKNESGEDLTPFLSQSAQPPLMTHEQISLSSSVIMGHQEMGDESDVKSLRAKIRSLQGELEGEKETVCSMRKKLNSIERDRLNTISRANEELSRLDSTVTKLQAQLERGEAVRHGLEYELTKAKKEATDVRRGATEREELMQAIHDGTKGKLDQVMVQVDSLRADLDAQQSRAKEEAKRLRDIIHSKDEELFSNQNERETIEREKQKVISQNDENTKVIEELEDRIHGLESSQRDQNESLRRQMHENEFMKEKEDRLRKDLDGAQERIKLLEESIEAERAAHLESKFNSEIVQLRIRDLEGALEVEKTQKTETSAASDTLSKQIRELQEIYEEERRRGQVAQDSLKKSEREFASVNKKLRGDLSDKTHLIKQLSSQLDQHQSNFNELKQEMTKVKKRQIVLEETYTGSIKELEILLDNFEPVSSDRSGSSRKVTKSANKKREGNKSQTLSSLLESLRRVLIDYKRKLDDTSAECSRIKSQEQSASKELDQYKEMLWHKDKALETAQQGLARTSKELRHYQTEARELEVRAGALSKEVTAAKTQAELKEKESTELKDQMFKVVNKCKTDEKTSGEFLHALYRQLTSAAESPVIPKTDFSSVQSWEDLARLVSEETAAVISRLQRAKEKVLNYEALVANNKQTISELQSSHEVQLSKLSNITDTRSQQWSQQRADLEAHYTQLLSELHARHKKSQAIADQAWDKVRANTTVQQSLETQCSQLQSTVTQLTAEHSALHSASAVLLGLIFPLIERVSAVVKQKNIIADENMRLNAMGSQVRSLVDALRLDVKKVQTPEHRPILRFRVAVVSVIAANRIHHLGRVSVRSPLIPQLPYLEFCAGDVEDDGVKFSGLSSLLYSNERDLSTQEKQALSWLTGDNVVKSTVNSMSDLTTALQTKKDSSMSILSATHMAIQRLHSQMQNSFGHLKTMPDSRKNSLCRRLGHGLRAVLQRDNAITPNPYLESQKVALALQDQVLVFTQRLHSAEVERHDLRTEVTRLKEAHNSLTHRADVAHILESEVIQLQEQVDSSVEKKRFDAVCLELNNALRREQEAQDLLKEQAGQLQHLTQRMDFQRSEGSDKERTLTEAVQDLNSAKAEARRHEQRAKQLTRELESIEEEKKGLQGNVSDAEAALRTAARDRDNLICYIRNVQRHLESAKAQLAFQLNLNIERLLSDDLVPPHASSKQGTGLAACRSLVNAFVDLEKQLEARVEALQGSVKSHENHVSQLKQELRDACTRAIGPQAIDDLAIAEIDLVNQREAIRGSKSLPGPPDDDFEPLKFDEVPVTVPKKAAWIADKAQRPAQFQTPQQLPRTKRKTHGKA